MRSSLMYSYDVQGVRRKVTKTKCILAGYIIVPVTYTLQFTDVQWGHREQPKYHICTEVQFTNMYIMAAATVNEEARVFLASSA